MRSSFLFSIWLGAILYALVGLFGIVVFYNAGPSNRALLAGYGVADNAATVAHRGHLKTLTR